MGLLDRAYAAGVRGAPLRTYGGRLIPTGSVLTGAGVGADPALDAARGRFARNAIIQGAAAELFKAWAATVRATTRELGAQVVLCLHDELLVHAPLEHAGEVSARVDRGVAGRVTPLGWRGAGAVRRGHLGDPPVVRGQGLTSADTSVIARASWSRRQGCRVERGRQAVSSSATWRRKFSKSAPSSSADGSCEASVASRLGRSLPSR
jgi:hypothetical protein